MKKNKFDILFESTLGSLSIIAEDETSTSSSIDDWMAQYRAKREKKEQGFNTNLKEFRRLFPFVKQFYDPELWINNENAVDNIFKDVEPEGTGVEKVNAFFKRVNDLYRNLKYADLGIRFTGMQGIPGKSKLESMIWFWNSFPYYVLFRELPLCEKYKTTIEEIIKQVESGEYEGSEQVKLIEKKLYELKHKVGYQFINTLKTAWEKIEEKPVWFNEDKYNEIMLLSNKLKQLEEDCEQKIKLHKKAEEEKLKAWGEAEAAKLTPEKRKELFRDYGWENSWKSEDYANMKKIYAIHAADRVKNPELHKDLSFSEWNGHVQTSKCSCGLMSKVDSSG
jgi:hypothetical protein